MTIKKKLGPPIILPSCALLLFLFNSPDQIGQRMCQTDRMLLRTEKLLQTGMQTIGRHHRRQQIEDFACFPMRYLVQPP